MEIIIMIVDGLATKLAVLAFILVVIKALTKKMTKTGQKTAFKLDGYMMKIHRPAGYVLIGAGIIHGILSLRMITDYSIIVFITGLLCLLSCFGAIAGFMYRKKLANVKNWLIIHRFMTFTAIVTLVIHVASIRI